MENFGFLITDVSRLLRRKFDERARLIGVTRAQWRLLTTLQRNQGLRQAALAELLEVEAISLCRMIDRMEEAGLVERKSDASDRRAWQIYLTQKSHPILDKLRIIADDLFEASLRGMNPAALQAMNDALRLIQTNLGENVVAERGHNRSR